MAKEQFKSNEAEDILMEAARRQAQTVGSGSDISKDRLHDMAAELDISPETLEQVLAERETAARESELRAAFIRERRASIKPTVLKYMGPSLMLFGIWFVFSHGGHAHPWFIYPLLFAVVRMVTEIVAGYSTSGTEFETEFEKFKKQREQREKDRERRAARRESKNASKRAAELAEQELDADPGDVVTPRSYNTKTDSDDEVLRVGRGR